MIVGFIISEVGGTDGKAYTMDEALEIEKKYGLKNARAVRSEELNVLPPDRERYTYLLVEKEGFNFKDYKYYLRIDDEKTGGIPKRFANIEEFIKKEGLERMVNKDSKDK